MGKRYLVPVGAARFDRSGKTMRLGMDRDTVKKYPTYDGSAFTTAGDEGRADEERLLASYGHTPIRTAEGAWDYEQYPEFRQPDWWITEGVSVSPRERHTPLSEPTNRRAEPSRPPFDEPSGEGRSLVDETRPTTRAKNRR